MNAVRVAAAASLVAVTASLIALYYTATQLLAVTRELERLRELLERTHRELEALKGRVGVSCPWQPAMSCDVRAIVYILPSRASSSVWRERYGDRIYFYVYADLSGYRELIREDFRAISKVYNTVVIVIPADDERLFLKNLKLIDELAREAGLKVMWAIFPKWKYGPEISYLERGTPMNRLVVSLMEYLARLYSTWRVAVWYGWRDRASPEDIVKFYEQLPEGLKPLYTAWLDEPYAEVAKGLVRYDPQFLVVTELYSERALIDFSGLLKRQMVVTGYYGAATPEDWLRGISRKISLVRGMGRYLCIWIFYDLDDGHREFYTAYRPEWGALSDPYTLRVVKLP